MNRSEIRTRKAKATVVAACSPDVILRLIAVARAAQARVKGSHAMGCLAYGTVRPRPCDCGLDALCAALDALGDAS